MVLTFGHNKSLIFMFHRQILFFNCFSKVYRNIVHVEHSDARWSKFNSYAVIPAFKPPLDRTMYSNSLTMIDMTSSIKHQVAGNKTINQQPNIAFMQFKNQLLLENNSSCGTPGIIMKSKNNIILLSIFFWKKLWGLGFSTILFYWDTGLLT